MNTAELIALLNVLGTVASKALDAYHQARDLAAKGGVSKADLDAADQRFLHQYDDPLAAESPVPVPSSPDPTSVEYSSLIEAMSATTAVYPLVIAKPDGKYVIWPNLGPFPGTKVYPPES